MAAWVVHVLSGNKCIMHKMRLALYIYKKNIKAIKLQHDRKFTRTHFPLCDIIAWVVSLLEQAGKKIIILWEWCELKERWAEFPGNVCVRKGRNFYYCSSTYSISPFFRNWLNWCILWMNKWTKHTKLLNIGASKKCTFNKSDLAEKWVSVPFHRAKTGTTSLTLSQKVVLKSTDNKLTHKNWIIQLFTATMQISSKSPVCVWPHCSDVTPRIM